MDFNVRNFATVDIFGVELWITESLVNMWIIMAILIVAAVIIRAKLTTYSETSPKGLQNVMEAIVEMFDRFVRSSAGDKLAYLGHWFFGIFMFIMLSNFSGIFIRPPTADWAVTFPIAFVSFLLMQYSGLRYRPKAYLKGFFEPVFIFFPLNVLGELAKPIALSFRLFGNILGGMILIGMIYGITPMVFWFIIPVPLHAYFDLAMGLLQTYIFVVLSLFLAGLQAGKE